jgi:formate hydrogenlyase transcriptional activator
MSTNIDEEVVVLTGGSAGLGEDAAPYLAARGGEHNAGDHRVAQFARAALPLGQRQLAGQDCAGDKFEEIIGNSSALEMALAEVELVAPTDSTVLILGETGTGKELIARAIYNASRRCGRPFVRLNCAAIPFDLLESELFGHERGAFTGATSQKIGRFEMADTGTLFLDEIGDIPLALQPKLLRVLQEQEFERLGSGRTHRINVRLVAATHRDLPEMVTRNEFRSDLYYRLNVFPVVLPPLRERQGDVPQLVAHFVEIYARGMGKRISYIPKETLEAFTLYSWPGNVRELQNLVERAVIRSDDGVLSNPFPTVFSNPLPASNKNRATFPRGKFVESQRALIFETLRVANWVIGGPSGAAARLGLKRTTLIAKMKKFGISRPVPSDDRGELTDSLQGGPAASYG